MSSLSNFVLDFYDENVKITLVVFICGTLNLSS